MDVELAQAIMTVDNEMKGNIHYPQWDFIVNKVKQLEIANGSVWGIVADSDEENENLQTQIESLEEENNKLKILVASIAYEISQLWNENEMNEDLRNSMNKVADEVDLLENNNREKGI